MNTTDVFMVPDNRGGQNSFDPNLLLASMMNGNNGFGGNGNWMWVIFLFFLYPLMRNGFWGNNGFGGDNGNLGSLGNLVNNDAGRERRRTDAWYGAKGRRDDYYENDYERDEARGRGRGRGGRY